MNIYSLTIIDSIQKPSQVYSLIKGKVSMLWIFSVLKNLNPSRGYEIVEYADQ